MARKKLTPLPIVVATLAVLVACGGKIGDTTAALTEPGVELRRTSFGVPHIKAADEKGLGIGLGFAYAQDNFCLMADAMVTIAGERSKYFGAANSYSVFDSPGDELVNLTSDFYYKYLNDAAVVKEALLSQPAEIQALIAGYAVGFNKYLADTGAANLPDACKGKPWIRNMTSEDIIRLTRRYAVISSGATKTFINAFSAASPPMVGPAANASTSGPGRVPALAMFTQRNAREWDKLKTGLGSNAVALGKDTTESGAGLLYANPHFPWGSTTRFYQMHLTIPGKVDVMGASLGGLPLVNIGFNENVAWSHTVNYAPRFALFALSLDPSDSTKYMMDGKSKPMTKKELSVETVTNGVAQTVKRTFYFSEQGPIVADAALGMGWTYKNAFAMTDVNFSNHRMLKQWWDIDKATSLASMKASLEATVGLPWVNTVATDRQGQVFYGNFTPVPLVSDAQLSACVPAELKPYQGRGIYILAGHTSACALGDDPAAPQKGIFAGSKLPSLLRNDYVQNSNDTHWLTNPAQPILAGSAIMGANSGALNARTRQGLTQIESRLSGADGLAGRKFTAANLQQIAMSNDAYYARSMLADLREACIAPSSDIAKGCAVIANWDGKANSDSVGWPLFEQWYARMESAGPNFWKVQADPHDPIHTPSGLRVSDPAVKARARQALAAAMQALDGFKIDYTKPWGSLIQVEAGGKRIAMHGGSGGVWDPASGLTYSEQIYNAQNTKQRGDGTLIPMWGSSIVLTVSFEGGTPKAQGFLSYSQSTDPRSPHASDQTERFARKEWITFPFTEAQILSDPGYALTRLPAQ